MYNILSKQQDTVSQAQFKTYLIRSCNVSGWSSSISYPHWGVPTDAHYAWQSPITLIMLWPNHVSLMAYWKNFARSEILFGNQLRKWDTKTRLASLLVATIMLGCCAFITTRQRSCGKVTFSVVSVHQSVILSTAGGISYDHTHDPPWHGTSLYRDPPAPSPSGHETSLCRDTTSPTLLDMGI